MLIAEQTASKGATFPLASEKFREDKDFFICRPHHLAEGVFYSSIKNKKKLK